MLQKSEFLKQKKSQQKVVYLFYFILCAVIPAVLASFTRCKNNLLFHTILISSGWIAWTYTEYFFHRFAMHKGKGHKHSAASKKHQHHHRSPSVFDVTLPHRVCLGVLSIFFFPGLEME